ncbi:MAG TPA: ABC transporter ATP-binding protein [Methylomirabilota bacterium]|nr:ABC transporter ATP-binding protein [Methylomirabilota bacterium]
MSLLDVQELVTGYGRKQVTFEVTLRVEVGEVVALMGHNGAGKTTTLKAIAGLLPVWNGRILLDAQPIGHVSSAVRVRRGLGLVPQEHFVFADLTVSENLELGAFSLADPKVVTEQRDKVLALLPVLAERRRQLAGTLSGGEQRMLSLGMVLMRRPRLLLLDEPSLGLAPLLVERIMETIRDISRRDNLTVLLVEQNVRHALAIARRVYVMRTGRVLLEETAAAMAARGQWWDLF